eukprot:6138658-Karenia_brevis.AAC.1
MTYRKTQTNVSSLSRAMVDGSPIRKTTLCHRTTMYMTICRTLWKANPMRVHPTSMAKKIKSQNGLNLTIVPQATG